MTGLIKMIAVFTGLCFTFAALYGVNALHESQVFDFDKLQKTSDILKFIDLSVFIFALFGYGVAEFFTRLGYLLAFVINGRTDTPAEPKKSNVMFIFWLGILSVVLYITVPLAEQLLKKTLNPVAFLGICIKRSELGTTLNHLAISAKETFDVRCIARRAPAVLDCNATAFAHTSNGLFCYVNNSANKVVTNTWSNTCP